MKRRLVKKVLALLWEEQAPDQLIAGADCWRRIAIAFVMCVRCLFRDRKCNGLWLLKNSIARPLDKKQRSRMLYKRRSRNRDTFTKQLAAETLEKLRFLQTMASPDVPAQSAALATVGRPVSR